MKNQLKGVVIATAVASMFFAASAFGAEGHGNKAEAKQVKCEGVNQCKGQGACNGPGHACAGQNACKGKGFLKMSAKDCKAKGGKVMKD